ncbi:MAG: NAD-dependent epimerase/dehydratase family protein [Janthinobacterium lividum]
MEAKTKTRRVLVTGAAGGIGSYFAEQAHARYDLRLMVRGDEEKISDIDPWGEVVQANLADLDRLKEVCVGVDTVVHLAGNPSGGALWQDLLETNIIGTYNVFAAAKAAGVRRVIYASSIHAVSGYPADVQVKADDPVNPGDLYGVSKCFGEALARYMAEKEGVSAIAVRIGAFQSPEAVQDQNGLDWLDDFVSKRDLVHLIEQCIDTDNLPFAILHGLSDNRFKRLDISQARKLVGYAPQDDAMAEMPGLREMHLRDHNDGGAGPIEPNISGLRAEVR